MSSRESGADVELEMIAGRGDGAARVEHGELLLRFADAAFDASPAELAAVREEVAGVLGLEAVTAAAATVAIFYCNVRVADATGIPLDEKNQRLRQQAGQEIGIERFAASAETKA